MADAGHSVRILAGRGDQFDNRIPFVSIAEIDSRNSEIEALKLKLDQSIIPPEFDNLVARLENVLSQTCAGTQVLIAHNVCSLHKNLALTAALKHNHENGKIQRLILWHHDLAWTTPRYRSELHEGVPWDLLRQDWSGATQVTISVTRQKELASLIGIPLERIRVVPAGLDLKRFLKLEPQTQDLVAKLDLLAAVPLLLLPVRITPRKNIELAIGVMATLRNDFPHARLVVTGPLGPHNPANAQYFDRLRTLRSELGLKDSVHFLAEHSAAFLPDAVIADFYHLADALLLPSKEEGFGIPILEAGLTGIPIFCADIPQLRELGMAEVWYFSPLAEPAEVARMVSQVLAQDARSRLRWRVRMQYTWERIYQVHIAALLESEGGAE
jgi:glycosyltransferase involved in cell wall biosynthesis